MDQLWTEILSDTSSVNMIFTMTISLNIRISLAYQHISHRWVLIKGPVGESEFEVRYHILSLEIYISPTLNFFDLPLISSVIVSPIINY